MALLGARGRTRASRGSGAGRVDFPCASSGSTVPPNEAVGRGCDLSTPGARTLASVIKLTALTDTRNNRLSKRCKQITTGTQMINTQLFHAIILALVALAGAAVAFSAAMHLAARTVPRPSQPPQGGSRLN